MGLKGLVLTANGKEALAKAENSEEALNFECISIGDGRADSDFGQMEGMANERFRLPILKQEREGGALTLTADFSNAQAKEGFYLRELGVIANGILYAYDNAGEDADLIEPYGSALSSEMRISCVLEISGTADVSVTVKSGMYASQKDLEKSIYEISEMKKKLDGIDENANKYTHPTGAGSRHIPSGGSNGQVLTWKGDGTAEWGSGSYYGVCSTPGTSDSKAVNAEGFSLMAGAEVTVKFTETNTAHSPKLNVNGTGAKPIYFHGAAIPSGYPEAGSVYGFRYNGVQWELVGDLVTYRNKPWFCVCGSRKADVAKTVDLEGFRLFDGVRAAVYFTWGNTAENITLNINGTGAYPVKYKNEPLPAGFIQAEWAVEVAYHAGFWRVVGDLADKRAQELAERIDGMMPSDIGALPVSGNAVSASKWNTARKINGMGIDGTADRTNYGVCPTSGSTAAKTVSCTGFNLVAGAEVTVKFNNTNTALNPTLNVNGTGAKAVYYKGAAVLPGYIRSGGIYTFRYTGTRWEAVGDLTQEQVDALKLKISSLQAEVLGLKTEVADLKTVTSALFEKIGTDPIDGALWEYRSQDSIPRTESRITGAKCESIQLEKGATYKVVTSIAEEYKGEVFAVMEVIGSYPNYGYNGTRINGTGAKDSFTIKPRESSAYLLINCCGMDSNIEVYKLNF